MVAGPFPPAHLTVDSSIEQAVAQIGAEQQVVEPQILSGALSLKRHNAARPKSIAAAGLLVLPTKGPGSCAVMTPRG